MAGTVGGAQGEGLLKADDAQVEVEEAKPGRAAPLTAVEVAVSAAAAVVVVVARLLLLMVVGVVRPATPEEDEGGTEDEAAANSL